jgi:hypothetical protein
MSDREIIINLLRGVEWRLRIHRLLGEFMLAASVVLAVLVALKTVAIFFPVGFGLAVLAYAATALLFVGCLLWRFRRRGTLDQAAISVDQKAGLNDEIKTALWFIHNPRNSEWVDGQIQRAARKAAKVDLRRAYPGAIPRASYGAAAMAVLLISLNFVALPQPAPDSTNSSVPGSDTLAGRFNLHDVYAGLDEIAAQMRQVERLKPVAEALAERRLNDAADELRRLGLELNGESPEFIENIKDTFQAIAAANAREALQPFADDLAEAARALMNNDTASAQEAIDDSAGDLEDLDEEIYKQESPRDQLAPGNERRGEQDGHVPGAPIPDERNFPQGTKSNEGLGASGGNAEPGPRRGEATTLDVKLQQEGLQGMPVSNIDRIEVEEASRQERSKLDYRNVQSELTSAQKDALKHETMPWKYRPLIKGYFQFIPEQTQSK